MYETEGNIQRNFEDRSQDFVVQTRMKRGKGSAITEAL